MRSGAEWVWQDLTRADTLAGVPRGPRMGRASPPTPCSAPGQQVPAPEEPLHGPGRGLVHLRLSRVQHAAPADLRGQVTVTQ